MIFKALGITDCRFECVMLVVDIVAQGPIIGCIGGPIDFCVTSPMS
jgi:hypothetical protein